MVTVAVSLLVLSTVDVAFTVSVVSVSAAATVSFPLVSMAVPAFLPVSTIDQVTVCLGLLVPSTVAVNVTVSPLTTFGVLGLIVTLVTVGTVSGSGLVLGLVPVSQPVRDRAAIENPIIATRVTIPKSLKNFFMINSLQFVYLKSRFFDMAAFSQNNENKKRLIERNLQK
jgi:hypothetical protein